MTAPRVRTFLSLGLLGCVTAALVPLGCQGARIRYPERSEGPRIPDATAERLRACVDEFAGDLPRGYHTFDATVTVDGEGHVVDVKSKGVPHEELAICMRIALRGMTVPEHLLRVEKLRLPPSPASTNEQTPAEREVVGHPALVVVAIALGELAIEAGPYAIAILAAVEISGEIAEVARKKKDDVCTANLKNCLMSPLAGKRGEHWRGSLCYACFKQCRPRKKWPEEPIPLDDELVSCQY